MSAEKSDAGGSFLANPNALLALVTIAGGLWLVSNKLTSDRPVTPAGGSKGFVADQKVEARLWEDPFKNITSGEERPEGSNIAAGNLGTLVEQISRRIGSGNNPPSSSASAVLEGVLLLPVMLPGGQYSEDKESRIRSRFAIISALGRSGYVPEDAEHIGGVTIPWLTQRELADAMQGRVAAKNIARLWDEKPSYKKPRLLGIEASERSSRMEMRYEWYRPRMFAAGSTQKKGQPAVLVLWLDDSYFEDEPLLRLPLLLEPLTDLSPVAPHAPTLRVKLIGPRRSSTLRNMMPDWQTGKDRLSKLPNRDVERLAKQVLGRIDVYCATPSAMDEVLVKSPGNSDEQPRAVVEALLKKQGFASFHNFTATDAQLAREVFEELALRRADLSDEKNHVVLISEWDTFYGRMLSLTYGAELALRQRMTPTRAAFVEQVISEPKSSAFSPKNFHAFAYLRGLDGQTVGAESGARETGDESPRRTKVLPSSIEELHWAPDINKAEGQAQFDYLGRLGDRVAELQRTLRSEGDHRIKAIGIVGSDVYDTLLILQALRQRFPNVLFFTTDLDVRFFHPHERAWARNLIVVSSYGLALHRSLQETVAPFRDSTQTAQFAATLAAFGDEGLAGITKISPRRFEIGNGLAVDLSVASNDPLPSEMERANAGQGPADVRYLHPLTTSEAERSRSNPVSRRVVWSLVAGVLVLVGASWMWLPLRRLTWEGWTYPGQALEYSEEDIGGPDGAEALLRWLPGQAGDAVADWLLRDERLAAIKEELEKHPTCDASALDWGREDLLAALTGRFVARLNLCLSGEKPHDLQLQRIVGEAREKMGSSGRIGSLWPPARRMVERHKLRLFLDEFLDRVQSIRQPANGTEPFSEERRLAATATASRQSVAASPAVVGWALDFVFGQVQPTRAAIVETNPDMETGALRAAVAARDSAEAMYYLRRRRLAGFWLGFATFGVAACGLMVAIWYDTFKRADGEPFSLSSGTSAWPAEIVRLLVILLAVNFGVGLSNKMRESFFALTRGFRFAPPIENPQALDRVCAESIWHQYRESSHFRQRFLRIFLAFALYFLGLMAIFSAQGEEAFHPIRGNLITVLNGLLILMSVLGFLLLAFLTIDASRLCRSFIEKISAQPTQYPEATRRHFSRQMGRIDMEYLDEWIDLQLIAELTEKVGRLVYYPAALVFLLLLARNSWWDAWSWPESLIAIFALNFVLALTSVVILQRAARDAKHKAEQSLAAKVKKLQAQTARSEAENNAAQAEKLLEEIRQLRRGAFVPFWENPVVGAVFLSSGGTTILQMFIWFMSR